VKRDAAREPFLLRFYEQFAADNDSAAFIRRIAQHYCPPTLERLAEWGAAEVRRAAISALGFVANYESNTVLGRALSDPDHAVRTLAEKGIRAVWCRAGNEYHRQKLEVIVRLNSKEHHHEALRRAAELIDQAPWFAEAWNQRAIAQFHLGRYAESIRDCHQALEINPYHFGAAVGMGHCYLRMGKPLVALECFQRALKLNPNLDAIRGLVRQLKRSLRHEP
jgi:tetratricopeptide (TPR) repeat protein